MTMGADDFEFSGLCLTAVAGSPPGLLVSVSREYGPEVVAVYELDVDRIGSHRPPTVSCTVELSTYRGGYSIIDGDVFLYEALREAGRPDDVFERLAEIVRGVRESLDAEFVSIVRGIDRARGKLSSHPALGMPYPFSVVRTRSFPSLSSAMGGKYSGATSSVVWTATPDDVVSGRDTSADVASEFARLFWQDVVSLPGANVFWQ